LAFSAAAKSAKLAGEILEDSSKLAKYASKAARVLKIVAVLGVVADAVLLAYAYFAEKDQRDKLHDAIHQLYVSRIIAKFYTRLCDAIKTQDGMMISYLIMVSDEGTIDPDDQRAADKIANKMISFIQVDWKEVDSESSLNLLLQLDHRRDSWMEEDPSYTDSIAEADNLKESLRSSSQSVSTTAVAAAAAAAPPLSRKPFMLPTKPQNLATDGLRMSDAEIDAELLALEKEFEDLLPAYTRGNDPQYDLTDIPGQMCKMVDTNHLDKAAIAKLFA